MATWLPLILAVRAVQPPRPCPYRIAAAEHESPPQGSDFVLGDQGPAREPRAGAGRGRGGPAPPPPRGGGGVSPPPPRPGAAPVAGAAPVFSGPAPPRPPGGR